MTGTDPVSNWHTTQSITRSARLPLRRIQITVTAGNDRGLSRELEEDTVISIGHAADNDIRLSDPTVSHYHVELFLRDNSVRVRDLESRNGTYVGQARILDAEIESGTILGLGHTQIRIGDITLGEPASEELFQGIDGIVAESQAMKQVVRQIRRVASVTSSVLVQGETGTGKEVVARAIHRLSERNKRPFVVVDCGALSADLILSELFGHEKGAFTNAERLHTGAFERANGGTLFLDEIGELPLSVQPALLGAIERRSFRRVGGERELELDVRIIAATHRDLRGAANAGTFRADLYYRLAVTRIVVPPLRERYSDLAELARQFAREITGSADAQPFDGRALEMLRLQHFHGNVRELRNLVENQIVMGVFDLPPNTTRMPNAGRTTSAMVTYREARTEVLLNFEREYLSRLIAACGNNVSEAARRAQMDRPYLLSLLRKHSLRAPGTAGTE